MRLLVSPALCNHVLFVGVFVCRVSIGCVRCLLRVACSVLVVSCLLLSCCCLRVGWSVLIVLYGWLFRVCCVSDCFW